MSPSCLSLFSLVFWRKLLRGVQNCSCHRLSVPFPSPFPHFPPFFSFFPSLTLFMLLNPLFPLSVLFPNLRPQPSSSSLFAPQTPDQRHPPYVYRRYEVRPTVGAGIVAARKGHWPSLAFNLEVKTPRWSWFGEWRDQQAVPRSFHSPIKDFLS